MNTKSIYSSVFIVILLMFVGIVQAEDWVTYMHDAARTGVSSETVTLGDLNPQWTYTSPAPPQVAWCGGAPWDAWRSSDEENPHIQTPTRDFDFAFPVTIVGNDLYFGSSVTNSIYCVNAGTGIEQWAFTTDGPVRYPPTFDSDKLYFGSDDGYAYCVDAADGSLVWKYSPGGDAGLIGNNNNLVTMWPIRTGTAVLNGKVYFAASMANWKSSYLCSVDAATGSDSGAGLYKVSGGYTPQGAILASSTKVYLTQGRLSPYVFNISNGSLAGALGNTGSGGCYALLAGGSYHYGHQTQNESSFTVNEYDAEVLDSIAIYDDGRTIVVIGSTAYVHGETALVAINRSNSNAIWTVPSTRSASLISVGNYLFAGGQDEVVAYDITDGSEEWSQAVDGTVRSLAFSGGRLYVSTDTGSIHMFGTALESDNTPPTPDPMTFAIAPNATGSTSISMTATTATDTSGVEYYFTCIAGGGNDSVWQNSTYYEDTGLTPDTQYTYTVTARDKSVAQNATAASSGASATTNGGDVIIYSESASAPTANIVASWTTNNSLWNNITVANNDGVGTENMYGQTFKHTAGFAISAITINATTDTKSYGAGQMLELAILKDTNADDHPDELVGSVYSIEVASITGSTPWKTFTFSNPVNCVGNTTYGFVYTLIGPITDNMRVATDNTAGYLDGNGVATPYAAGAFPDLPIATNTFRDLVFVVQETSGPDTTPPTPNPATFAVAPAADSDTAISMTATTGSDASSPVEYLFTETSGNPGATSSSWQTSTSYTDSGLTESTQYTYTVTMRDSLDNIGTASSPASATTQAAVDADPPTPNPATFAVAPAADSSSAISMTATTGSDASGPVEYLFTETSGNPGATSSSWQISTSYTDTGLTELTQYTYTVTMRDSRNNTGTASSPASATTGAAYAYYVATSGNDGDPGTLAQPFATIQKAADTMVAGDTCYIRGGSYHEEVSITGLNGSSGSPITFTNYNGEAVTLDGSIPITSGWTQHSGNIYKTTLAGDISQVFVDGEWMMLARWPNARFDDDSVWTFDNWAQGDESLSVNGVVEYDAAVNGHDLAASGLDMNDATVVLNLGNFITEAKTVTSHSAGQNNFTYSTPMGTYKTVNHYYFMDSKLNLLDNETEWYFDPATKTLYLWTPGGGTPTGDIRGKNMDNAFFFTNSQYINVKGLDFFATTFRLDGCDNVTVEDCDLKYPCFNKRTLGDNGEIFGTLIEDCTYVNVLNCSFAYTDGLVMKLFGGNNNTVENCELHHLDYTVAHHSGNSGFLWFRVSEFGTFKRNTIYKSGASEGIMVSSDMLIELNDFCDLAHLQNDGAYVQLMQGDYRVDVANNWFHDSLKPALRLSDGPKDYLPDAPLMRTGIARRNVAFGPKFSGNSLQFKGDERECYNNLCKQTFRFSDDSGDPATSGIHANSVSANNVTGTYITLAVNSYVAPSGTHLTNWEGGLLSKDIKDQVRDWDNLDFRPKVGSDLIDVGTIIAGVTDGYLGTAPDKGAYESGDTNYWIPGRKLEKTSTPIPPDNAAEVKTDADLMWLDGYRATSHDVYFGTNPGSLVFQGNQTNNIFDPGTLTYGTTYYWRVDAVTPGGTITGDIWSFLPTSSPEFTADPIYEVIATADVDYSSTLTDDATDPESDPLIFSKLSGPAWLSVASNGALSGTPSTGDVGLNIFTVQVDDDNGGTDTATLNITVVEGDAVIYSESASAPTANIVASWTTDNSLWNTITVANNDGVGTENMYGQTFKHTSDFAISAITINATTDTKSYGAGQMLELAILKDTNADDHPDELVGSVYSIEVASITGSTPWKTFTFSNPVNCVGNTTYGFVYTLIGPITDNMRVATDNTAGYLDGHSVATPYAAGAFPDLPIATNTNRDLVFVVQETSGPDTTPPTPNPATFAVAPAADNDTAISMTATTGSDASGPVEYLFTETSGNPGATSSSWQTTTSYTDSGLDASTQYTYTVTMRDSLDNTGTASSPASATTQAAPDTDPPTPNPATFAVAPAADSSSAISMTATTGSDASGPVEYLFTETSGNPGATSSSWQTSTSYTDSGLDASTQYTYTVTMRDSLDNTGTASSSASATTDSAGTPLPGQASSPSPSDGSRKIRNPILTWTAGSDATSHDVYFGTDSTPDSGELQGNQAGTSFDPGSLSGKTNYYWRIDEVNATGTTTGVVWQFKTK